MYEKRHIFVIDKKKHIVIFALRTHIKNVKQYISLKKNMKLLFSINT